VTLKLWQPDRDLAKGHPLLQGRWPVLRQELQTKHGIILQIAEVYRPDVRQQWLYGSGRGREKLISRGINPDFARPEAPIVTNAWSAKLSAHGYTLLPPFTGVPPAEGLPASCAMDVVPVGEDGTPWTVDDRWDDFVRLTDDVADIGGKIGLVHFHAPGKAVWDKPHLQLVEWSDALHALILTGG
jgi:hypothetical protein